MNRGNSDVRVVCAALLATTLWAFSSGHLAAQVDEPSEALPEPLPQAVLPTPPEVAPLEEQKIDQFADAYLAIEKIHAKAATELEATDDAEAANKVKANAEAQIIEAVERSGLRLEEFNQIADLMMVDIDLRSRIVKKVEERRSI